LGVYYQSLGQYPKAIEYYQQSLAIQKEIGDRNGEAGSLGNLGFAYYFLKQYPEAAKVLREAINIYESLRVKLTADTDKVSIFETQANSYELLQAVLIAQNQTDTALEISERGRARAFIELLAASISKTPDIQPTVTPITIQQIQQIARQENATLVEYSLVLNKIYCWVIKPTGEVLFRPVDPASLSTSLEELVKETRQELVSQADSPAAVASSLRSTTSRRNHPSTGCC
jgi:tetratricopeptide (TPR) repeat protein